MQYLKDILHKPILDISRTRRYQSAIDRSIDTLKETWDLDRGLNYSKGIDLPHENVAGYWMLDEDERIAQTDSEAARIYDANAGRNSTYALGSCAFAFHSPISRFHKDTELARYFSNGLSFHIETVRDDGVPALYGLNGLEWAHGWDIEGLIYGLVLLWDEIDEALRNRAIEQFRKSASRFLENGDSGTHGNQGCVQALGLFLYGKLLEMPDLVEASNARFAELVEKTLDDDGQVIEQYGPCMHYSYTCFVYAWLNIFLRHGDGHEERVEKCLRWFRYKHTESMYPFPGPSSRSYSEDLKTTAIDILGACEHVAQQCPMLQQFADKVWDEIGEQAGGFGHGSSPLMWAILACTGEHEPTDAQREEWNAPFEANYERINLLGRSPLKYYQVRRAYQTSFDVSDFLPFAGIQTWAWGDEPPIIHPTILNPSTTLAWGLDTARQAASYNWGLFGAGAMVPDFKFRTGFENGQATFMFARYDQLWRFLVLTDVSTVILEFGNQGERITKWTLNWIESGEVRFGDGEVSFKGRTPRIYSTAKPPVLKAVPDKEDSEVQILEYECGDGPAAFAFSDSSFEFLDDLRLLNGQFRFGDSSGTYRVEVDERFFGENRGSISLSRGELFEASKVVRER
jgi:hypothetical protein